jgi:hypothetical protein
LRLAFLIPDMIADFSGARPGKRVDDSSEIAGTKSGSELAEKTG